MLLHPPLQYTLKSPQVSELILRAGRLLTKGLRLRYFQYEIMFNIMGKRNPPLIIDVIKMMN